MKNRELRILMLGSLLTLGGFFKGFCQSELNSGSGNILLELKQIPYKLSVLYIAAHPDDENNRLLAYLVKGKHFRVGYLSLTRGEGGQNLIGKEQGETLGLIRTEELLAARKVDGAEQFFSRAIDFGYSKNPYETLKFWNEDSILSDIVWVIRKFKPDIIIDRFPTTGEGGHGNHTASAILTLRAVQLSSDSNSFISQLKYVKPWKVKKVFWNTFNFGGLNTTSKNQIHFQVNGYNPVLGASYGELAAKSRSFHKSQGFGTGSAKGDQYEYFSNLTSKNFLKTDEDIFDGLDSTWENVSGSMPAFQFIQEALKKYRADQPRLIIPELVKAYRAILKWPLNELRERKLGEISKLILECSGVYVECISPKEILTYGSTYPISIEVIRRENSTLNLEKISLASDSSKTILNIPPLVSNQVFKESLNLLVDSTESSQPYQLILPYTAYRYGNPNSNWVGLPKKISLMKVNFTFKIEDLRLNLNYPIEVKIIDPVKGEFFEPVSVVPPISAESQSKTCFFPNSTPKKIKVNLLALADHQKGYAQLILPKGWNYSPLEQEISIPKIGSTQVIEFSIKPPTVNSGSSLDTALIVTKVNSKSYHQSFHKIEYEHIPIISYLNPSSFQLVRLSLNSPKLKIGYIVGAGDYIPETLNQLGYETHLITDEELNPFDLEKYNTIIIGARAFNVRNALAPAHEILMNYVKNGGCLLIQYNTTANLIISQIGPFPFQIDRERITDETAKINITNPKSSLLNYPNLISNEDFKGWVQERGLYFTRLEEGSNYKTLFSMHDPGESDLKTGLIYTDYGKGIFIYTSLSFFRQLPAGVPGAVRLFVNLINAHGRR